MVELKRVDLNYCKIFRIHDSYPAGQTLAHWDTQTTTKDQGTYISAVPGCGPGSEMNTVTCTKLTEDTVTAYTNINTNMMEDNNLEHSMAQAQATSHLSWQARCTSGAQHMRRCS